MICEAAGLRGAGRAGRSEKGFLCRRLPLLSEGNCGRWAGGGGTTQEAALGAEEGLRRRWAGRIGDSENVQ